jgi:hypothetical protein
MRLVARLLVSTVCYISFLGFKLLPLKIPSSHWKFVSEKKKHKFVFLSETLFSCYSQKRGYLFCLPPEEPHRLVHSWLHDSAQDHITSFHLQAGCPEPLLINFGRRLHLLFSWENVKQDIQVYFVHKVPTLQPL